MKEVVADMLGLTQGWPPPAHFGSIVRH